MTRRAVPPLRCPRLYVAQTPKAAGSFAPAGSALQLYKRIAEILFSRDNVLISSAKQIFTARWWRQQTIYRPELSSRGSPARYITSGNFNDADAKRMPKDNDDHLFEDRDPATLFREFAAECIELAQTTSLSEKRALYARMASIWHKMAQRCEKK